MKPEMKKIKDGRGVNEGVDQRSTLPVCDADPAAVMDEQGEGPRG